MGKRTIEREALKQIASCWLAFVVGMLSAVSGCVLPAVDALSSHDPADGAETESPSDQDATRRPTDSSSQTVEVSAKEEPGDEAASADASFDAGVQPRSQGGSTAPASSKPAARSAAGGARSSSAGSSGASGAVSSGVGTAGEASTTNGGAAGAGGRMPGICSAGTPCEGPFNCIDRICVDPTPSCDHHKAANPDAGDGVYWINPSGTPTRAYCDMEQRLELCTDAESEHHGVLRDGSELEYTITSVLSVDARTCQVWALRDSFEQLPIDLFDCSALGFGRIDDRNGCTYGVGIVDGIQCSDCGFGGVDDYAIWSKSCQICISGIRCSHTCSPALTVDHYDQVVKVSNGGCLRIPTSFDGKARLSCRVE